MFNYFKRLLNNIINIISKISEKEIASDILYKENKDTLLVIKIKIGLIYDKINPSVLDNELFGINNNTNISLYIKYMHNIISMNKPISKEIISDSKRLLELLENIFHMLNDEYYVFNKAYSDRLIDLENKSVDALIKKYPIGVIDIDIRHEELKSKHVHMDINVASFNYLKYSIYLIEEEKTRIASIISDPENYHYLSEVNTLINLVNRYVDCLSLVKFNDNDPKLFSINLTANEIYVALTNVIYTESIDQKYLLKHIGEAISLIEPVVHKGELSNEFYKELYQANTQ